MVVVVFFTYYLINKQKSQNILSFCLFAIGKIRRSIKRKNVGSTEGVGVVCAL
jgi:hypothetical protein